MDPIPIELSRTQAGNEEMPVMVGAVEYWVHGDYVGWSRVLFPVEEQEFDPRSISGIQTEIHATGDDRGAERSTTPYMRVRPHER